jgi:hypothetical protein
MANSSDLYQQPDCVKYSFFLLVKTLIVFHYSIFQLLSFRIKNALTEG